MPIYMYIYIYMYTYIYIYICLRPPGTKHQPPPMVLDVYPPWRSARYLQGSSALVAFPDLRWAVHRAKSAMAVNFRKTSKCSSGTSNQLDAAVILLDFLCWVDQLGHGAVLTSFLGSFFFWFGGGGGQLKGSFQFGHKNQLPNGFLDFHLGPVLGPTSMACYFLVRRFCSFFCFRPFNQKKGGSKCGQKRLGNERTMVERGESTPRALQR